VNWAGFYVVYPENPDLLILGPFQGHVACQLIRFGKGVCGVAARDKQTQIVGDVEKFPGHIACDSKSRSEIVVPIIQDSKVYIYWLTPDQLLKFFKVVAIIDIDCAELDGFGEEDKLALEQFASLIAESCDFPLNSPHSA